LIAHRRLRETQIVDALRQGPAAIAALVEKLYPDIMPALRAAAAEQIRAHLEHLAEQDAVAQDAGLYRLKS